MSEIFNTKTTRIWIDLRSLHTESEFAMFATDAKTQKIQPDTILFMTDESFEAVWRRDWHNVRSYLFFNKWKFGTSVQWPFRVQIKG